MNLPSDPLSLESQREFIRRFPAPRRIRAYYHVQILVAIYYLGFGLFPLVSLSYVAFRFGKAEVLRAWGVSTVGKVVGSRSEVDDSETRTETTLVDYEFEVGGRTYGFRTSREGMHGVPREAVEVVYLASYPAVATSRSDLELPLMETGCSSWIIMGGTMAVVGVPIFIWILRPYRRRRRLAARGSVAEATIESVDVGEEVVGVVYTFQAGGRPQPGHVVVESTWAVLLRPGQSVTVLYDPRDPKVSDLLDAALESYQYVPDRA